MNINKSNKGYKKRALKHKIIYGLIIICFLSLILTLIYDSLIFKLICSGTASTLIFCFILKIEKNSNSSFSNIKAIILFILHLILSISLPLIWDYKVFIGLWLSISVISTIPIIYYLLRIIYALLFEDRPLKKNVLRIIFIILVIITGYLTFKFVPFSTIINVLKFTLIFYLLLSAIAVVKLFIDKKNEYLLFRRIKLKIQYFELGLFILLFYCFHQGLFALILLLPNAWNIPIINIEFNALQPVLSVFLAIIIAALIYNNFYKWRKDKYHFKKQLIKKWSVLKYSLSRFFKKPLIIIFKGCLKFIFTLYDYFINLVIGGWRIFLGLIIFYFIMWCVMQFILLIL
jgi:hypothetical protein